MKLEALETLARERVGDGQSPDLFFVTDQGTVVTVTRDYQIASTAWTRLAMAGRWQTECALENRTFGVLASVEPAEDDSDRMVVCDSRGLFARLSEEDAA